MPNQMDESTRKVQDIAGQARDLSTLYRFKTQDVARIQDFAKCGYHEFISAQYHYAWGARADLTRLLELLGVRDTKQNRSAVNAVAKLAKSCDNRESFLQVVETKCNAKGKPYIGKRGKMRTVLSYGVMLQGGNGKRNEVTLTTPFMRETINRFANAVINVVEGKINESDIHAAEHIMVNALRTALIAEGYDTSEVTEAIPSPNVVTPTASKTVILPAASEVRRQNKRHVEKVHIATVRKERNAARIRASVVA